MISDETLSFKFEKEKKEKSKEVLKKVYKDLQDKGYNPVNQIVGYILSGESTYITNYNGARNAIKSIERDELLEDMVKEFVGEDD